MVDKLEKIFVICMVGMPCSGKSTWIQDNKPRIASQYNTNVIVISRDTIRETFFGKDYKQNKEDEKAVTIRYWKELSHAIMLDNAVIILDNCHTKSSYIDEYIKLFQPLINSGKLEFFIKILKVPYLQALMRNYKRRVATGKWIPQDVLKSFHEAFLRLDTSNYREFV